MKDSFALTPPTHYSLYVIISSLLSAISLVTTEIVIGYFSVDPVIVAVLGNFVGGILLVSAARQANIEFAPVFRWPNWAILGVSGLSISAVAYVLSFYAIEQVGAGKTALLGQLETVFVVLLAVIFLGERLTPRRGLAGSLALAGALLINFDPQAWQFAFQWGELVAVLAPLGFAVGIVTIKPVLMQVDARLVTGLSLLVGSLVLGAVSPWLVASTTLAWSVLPLVAAIGIIRSLTWLTYYLGMKQIGASRSSIIFISFAFFTVILQGAIATVVPGLGLQLPPNLSAALVGGMLVAFGIYLLQTE